MQTEPAKLLFRVAAASVVVFLMCGFQYAYITNDTTGLPLKWAPGTISMQIMADNTTVLTDGNTRATSIQAAMQDAARGWNLYLGNVQFASQILPAGSGVDGDHLNQIFFSSNPYNRSWEGNTLAVSTAWYQGNTRVEADIIFNSAFTWDSYRGADKTSPVDLQRVAFHELGHVLGLAHPDEAGMTVQSVMNSSARSADSLQPYDALASEFLYGPPRPTFNDNFASAANITLSSNSQTFNGYNTNATKEAGEPDHANLGGRSVWWKWTPPSPGTLTVTTAGSVFDTTLGVYTGTDVSALTTLATNNDVQAGVNLSSTVTFAAVAGTTYYIAVDGFNAGDASGADSGGIALNLTFLPALPVQSESAVTGHSATFTVGPVTGTVQWQFSSDGGHNWTDLAEGGSYSGVATPTLTISSVSFGMTSFQYRAVVTDNTGATYDSGYGTLMVTQAYFNFPAGITIDGSDNLYVSDSSLQTIQKITSTTTITAVAGTTSSAGSTDGAGAAARFNQPTGLSATTDGVLGVADTGNATIRVVQPDGTVTTLAGSPSIRGNVDATGPAATFSLPSGVARDSAGNLLVADATNDTIRKVTPTGAVTTFAGSPGVAGSADGTGNAATFNYPTGIAVDRSGNAYVADTTNNLLRKITPAGVVTTIAGVPGVAGSTDGTGNGALFNMPGGVAVDTSGNVYLADTGNSTVRKITPGGTVTTLAGLADIAGFKDGTGSDAWFNQPKALILDSSGNIFVADTGNAAIRKVTPAGVVTTLSLAAPGTSTSISTTSTIPPTTDGTTSSGGGGAPSTWFFGALGLLAGLRRMFPKRG